MMGCTWGIETPGDFFLEKESFNLCLIPLLYSLPELPLCTDQVGTIVGSHQFYLAPSSNESPQHINEGWSAQGSSHLNVNRSGYQAREERSIALHLTPAPFHQNRTEIIHPGIGERGLCRGDAIQG